MKHGMMKCNDCDRDASLRHVSGMSGPQSDGKIPLCQLHHADWLFSRSGVGDAVSVGDGIYYASAHLIPDMNGEMMFEVFINIPPASDIGKQLPEGYFEQLEAIEKELFEEVTGINYDGEPVGYVVVDVNAEGEHFQAWGIFPKHRVDGEPTPKPA